MSVVTTGFRAVCAVFAVTLAVELVFLVGHANPENWLYILVDDLANRLTLGLSGRFGRDDPDLASIADYGLPALGWLLLGSLAGVVGRRLARW